MRSFLKVLVIISVFTCLSIILGLYLKDNDVKNKYNIEIKGGNSIISGIGGYFLKPIIELYVDARLDKYNLFDKIRMRMFYENVTQKIQLKPGEGSTIKCGDRIIISASSEEIETVNNLEYVVGFHNKPILNMAPIGMKKNEESIISVHPIGGKTLILEDTYSTWSLKINIIDILAPADDDEYQPTILRDRINNESPKMCGDDVSISYKVYDIRGKELKSDKKTLKIGDKILKFENYLIGIQPSSSMIALVKGKKISDEYDDELKILEVKLLQ